MAYIAEKDNVGKKTIDVLDLNRKRKNENKFRDNLPGKRGNILSYFRKEIRRYERLKDDLSRFRLCEAEQPDSNLKPAIDDLKIKIDKKIQGITKQFLSYSAEFSGMCIFWLNNDTPFADDFIGVAV